MQNLFKDKRKHFLRDKTKAVYHKENSKVFSNTSKTNNIKSTRSFIYKFDIPVFRIFSNNCSDILFIYYDFYSGTNGFRNFYTNDMVLSAKDLYKLNINNLPFQSIYIAGIKTYILPAGPHECKELNFYKNLKIIETTYEFIHAREKDLLFYGKPEDPIINKKYFGFKKTFCKRMASRNSRHKSKDWINKYISEEDSSTYPKSFDSEKSIAWCVS